MRPALARVDVPAGSSAEAVLTLLEEAPSVGSEGTQEVREVHEIREVVVERDTIELEPDYTAGILLLSIGALSLGGGGGTGAWWEGRERALSACDVELGCTNRPAIETERNTALGLTIALGGAGLTAVAIGVVLLASPPTRARTTRSVDATPPDTTTPDAPSTSLRCAPAMLGAVCVGTF